MKRRIGLFLSAVLAVSAVSGSAVFAEDAPLADTQEMTFVLSNEPDGIDPNVTNNSFAMSSPEVKQLPFFLSKFNTSDLVDLFSSTCLFLLHDSFPA